LYFFRVAFLKASPFGRGGSPWRDGEGRNWNFSVRSKPGAASSAEKTLSNWEIPTLEAFFLSFFSKTIEKFSFLVYDIRCVSVFYLICEKVL